MINKDYFLDLKACNQEYASEVPSGLSVTQFFLRSKLPPSYRSRYLTIDYYLVLRP